MKIKEVQARSILVKTNLPVGDFVINPYTGCQHACVYCYARFMKRFTGHEEPWGSFVDVKINSPEILIEQLKHFKGKKTFHVCLSSVTDPYQPLEKKYQITRKILEILVSYPQFKVEIITKSDLVLRDLDILKKLKNISVVMSLGIVNDRLAKYFEPQASLPSQRIKALAKIHAQGIKTSAFLSPILPFFTDFDKTFKQLKGKVNEVFGETFNPRGANYVNLAKILKARFPDKLKDYQKIFFSSYHHQYLIQTKKLFYESAKKYSLPVWGFFTH